MTQKYAKARNCPAQFCRHLLPPRPKMTQHLIFFPCLSLAFQISRSILCCTGDQKSKCVAPSGFIVKDHLKRQGKGCLQQLNSPGGRQAGGLRRGSEFHLKALILETGSHKVEVTDFSIRLLLNQAWLLTKCSKSITTQNLNLHMDNRQYAKRLFELPGGCGL